MTRETKIGLLVGMGVIILIGILISDHLSEAQRQQEAQLTHFAQEVQRSMEPPAIGESGAPEPARTAQRPEPLPLPEELHKPSMPVSNDRVPRFDNPPKPVVFRQDLLAMSTVTERSPLISSIVEEAVATEAPAQLEGAEELARLTRPATRDEMTRVAPDVAVAGSRSSGSEVVHHVQDGESLYAIAERYYGDGNYWKTIFEANQNVLPKPEMVRKGVRLVIPNKAGRVTVDRSAASTPAPVAAARQPEPTTRTYTVKSGDSLSKLAERFMGSSGKWQALYEMNKDRIKNPDVLVSGTEILVPGT